MEEMELSLREELFPHWVVYALLFTITMLSVLKFQKEMVFSQMSSTFFKAPSSLPNARENLSFLGLGNWVLLLNYFVVSGIAAFMLLSYLEINEYWLIALPSLIYLFQLSSLFFVGSLSGEFKYVKDNILLLNFTAHISGIALIPILFIWILNPQLSEYMLVSLASVLTLFYFIRLVRGFLLAIRNKALWYYIILYLCGLEIWPIVVGYLLVSPVFIG
ncbi:DUF4271 domain-containing protein [Brumimicrobium oceani]|uniref:DUF4271 domain-containing protein n=1 Tax=Brumimicrobium oceani TaxID=2100725 RepID=A0A2U2XD12_9FLAO|nr:DUF4271 domain-containing protein [Brumimicrobium oceani]PWH85686.1 hypothetical protein DIT68_08615 [Brumimicrobium oceani]